MSDPAQNNEQKPPVETVSKAEFDKLVEEKGKLARELEDVKLDVFNPDYLAFLESKNKPKEPVAPAKKEDDIDFEKLSKKEIYERARRDAMAGIDSKFDELKKQQELDSNLRAKNAVAEFAASHSDYEQLRPIMYGLSITDAYKGASLEKLYAASKDHVARIHAQVSEAEQARQIKMRGEKPGGASESYEDLRKLSKDQAAQKALEETKAALGPIPKA
jgi:hypothetical protein